MRIRVVIQGCLKRILHKKISFAICVCGWFLSFGSVQHTKAQKANFTADVYEGCAPIKISFTDASTGGTVQSRTWYTDIPFQLPIPNAASIQANYNTSGTYHVKLVVTFTNGVVDSFTKDIIIYPKPVIDFEADQTLVCRGTTIKFKDKSTTSMGTLTEWTWNLDLSTSHLKDPSQLYPDPNTYSISLLVKNNLGCTDQLNKVNYIKVVDKPDVRFSINPPSSCDDALTIFTTNSSLNAPSFFWEFGDGGTSTDPTPSHFYAKAGTYTGKLTSKVSTGCEDSKPFTVNTGTPSVQIDTFKDTLCQDEDFTFKGSVTPAGTSVKWFFSDNGQTVSGLNATHAFTKGGLYDVSFIATNSWNCSVTTTRKIFIIGKAVPDFTVSPQSTCDNTLTVSLINNTVGNVSFLWDFGDQSKSDLANPPPHTYPSGTYTLTLHCISSPGCESILPKPISVGGPRAIIDIFPDTICVGSKGQFKGSTTPADANGKWYFGDKNQYVDGKDLMYAFDTPGTFDVFFVALKGTCTDTTPKKKVFVSALPQPMFRIDTVTSCKTPFEIHITNLTQGNGLDFTWNFGDNGTSKEFSPSHTYTLPGERIVTLTVKDNTLKAGCTAIRKDTVHIITPSAVIGFSPAIPCSPPADIIFTVTTNGFIDPAVKYIWTFGDGSKDTTTVPRASHTYSTTGSKTVTVDISSDSGCKANPSRIITINKDCPSPLIFVSYNCNPCNSVTLRDTVSNSTIISWDMGGNKLSDSPTNPLTYLFPFGKADYTVTVTRRNNTTGKITQDSVAVHLYCWKPEIKVDKPATCMNDTITFTSAGIEPSVIRQFFWDFGDGIKVTVTNPPNGPYSSGTIKHPFTTSGIFVVKLIITDIRNCTTQSENFSVTIDGPLANFGAYPVTTCDSTLNVVFTDSTILNKGVRIAKWEWNFNDGQQADTMKDGSITHTFKRRQVPLTTYDVSLKVTDSLGCTNSKTKSGIIKLYHPVAAFNSPDTLHCNKYIATFCSQSKGVGLFETWYTGDDSIMKGNCVSHKYTREGIYTVKLMVTDEAGCKDSSTKNGYVKIIKPVARMAVRDTGKCAPVAIGFADSSSYAIKYFWDFGLKGSPSKDSSRSIPYDIPGIYTIKLIVTGPDGCLDSATNDITIKGARAKLTVDKPTTGCIDFKTTMRVTDRYNVKDYTWDYADGTGTNPNPGDSIVQKIYTRVGKYIPNVIITSTDGCNLALIPPDTIIADNVKAGFSLKQGQVCKDNKVIFENTSIASGISPIEKYEWDFGNGATSSLPGPLSIEYGRAGKFMPRLTVETHYGCRDTFMLPDSLNIFKEPLLSVKGADSLCESSTNWFRSEIQSEDAVSGVEWKLNGVGSGTGDSVKIQFDKAGAATLSLHVTTVHGCSTTVVKPIQVNPSPKPAAAPDTTICINSKFSLRAFDGEEYHWSPAAGITNIDVASPEVIPPLGATRYLVTVKNRFGCITKDSVLVQTGDSTRIHTVSPMDMCVGGNVRLQVSGNASGYNWSPSASLSDSKIASPIASPSLTTTYKATGISNNKCPNDIDSVEVIVHPRPHIDTITASPSPVLSGKSVVLEVRAGNDVTRYNWTPADKLSNPNSRRTVWQQADNSKTFRVVVSNQFNCTDTATIPVVVNCDESIINVPNAFTPNNDGNNDKFRPAAVSKNDPVIKKFYVYNRWGNLLYHEDGKRLSAISGWDGIFNGVLQEGATYVCWTVVECTSGDVFIKRAFVLVR